MTNEEEKKWKERRTKTQKQIQKEIQEAEIINKARYSIT